MVTYDVWSYNDMLGPVRKTEPRESHAVEAQFAFVLDHETFTWEYKVDGASTPAMQAAICNSFQPS